MKKARLLRYGRYQLADFAVERIVFVLILSALNFGGPLMSARALASGERIITPDSPLGREVMATFTTLVLLAVLFCSQELVSRNRKTGYYRFIFSKAVNPVAFYGQLFVVHLLATVAFVGVMAAAFSVLAAPVAIGHIALLTAIAFMLFGGIGFLVSAFMRFDSIVVIVAFGVSALVKAVASSYTGALPKLANLLLPTDHLFALRPLIFGSAVNTADVAWVVGYGAIAVIVGLLGVRYRQLAD